MHLHKSILEKKTEIIYNRSKNNLIINNFVKYAENLKFSNNHKTCALRRNASAQLHRRKLIKPVHYSVMLRRKLIISSYYFVPKNIKIIRYNST